MPEQPPKSKTPELRIERRGLRSFAAACPVCGYEFIGGSERELREAVDDHVPECSDPDGAWRDYQFDAASR